MGGVEEHDGCVKWENKNVKEVEWEEVKE